MLKVIAEAVVAVLVTISDGTTDRRRHFFFINLFFFPSWHVLFESTKELWMVPNYLEYETCIKKKRRPKKVNRFFSPKIKHKQKKKKKT